MNGAPGEEEKIRRRDVVNPKTVHGALKSIDVGLWGKMEALAGASKQWRAAKTEATAAPAYRKAVGVCTDTLANHRPKKRVTLTVEEVMIPSCFQRAYLNAGHWL